MCSLLEFRSVSRPIRSLSGGKRGGPVGPARRARPDRAGWRVAKKRQSARTWGYRAGHGGQVELIPFDPAPEGPRVVPGPLDGAGIVGGLPQRVEQEPGVRLGLMDDSAAVGAEGRQPSEVP